MRTLLSAVFVVLIVISSSSAQTVTLIAGGGDEGEGALATRSKLNSPFGVDFDKAGNLFFVEIDGDRLCRIDKSGIVRRVAGTAQRGISDGGGMPLMAQFNAPHNLAIAPSDDIYIADTLNRRVCKLDNKTGRFSTIAGTGEKGFAGDGGPADKARFSGIYCATLDPAGERLFMADLDNRRIRMVDLKTGIVTTIAGNGQKGIPTDGADAKQSPLVDPRAVVADRAGNVYVLERSGHCLRVVDPQGKIRTVVGTGEKGFSGDGGEARSAKLNGPKFVAIDHDGGVLICDTENHVIRKYTPADGKIARVAGSGKRGTAGVGGPALEVELNQPHGVYVHASGDLYIADSTNKRILKITRTP